jgi:hypothetical protein
MYTMKQNKTEKQEKKQTVIKSGVKLLNAKIWIGSSSRLLTVNEQCQMGSKGLA